MIYMHFSLKPYVICSVSCSLLSALILFVCNYGASCHLFILLMSIILVIEEHQLLCGIFFAIYTPPAFKNLPLIIHILNEVFDRQLPFTFAGWI